MFVFRSNVFGMVFREMENGLKAGKDGNPLENMHGVETSVRLPSAIRPHASLRSPLVSAIQPSALPL